MDDPIFVLSWFSAESDELIDSEEVAITLEEARSCLCLDDDETLSGSFAIQATERLNIGQFFKHQIDLNRYDYFLEQEEV